MQRIILFVFLAFFTIGFACKELVKKPIQTPLEKSNYSELTSNADLVAYLNNCDSICSYISVIDNGKSVMGKTIPLVLISDGKSLTNKIKVLFYGQQHGNEPAGKEGLLCLINHFANGEHLDLLKYIDLYIVPQCNPDGGDQLIRKNANDIDLNRDHLVLNADETKWLHKIYNTYLPDVIVDFHEYYPYGEGWKAFGYQRNFDVQLGGLTNANISEVYKNWQANKSFPEIKQIVEADSYTFFEYLLGYLPEGEPYRKSTVDINDGRQSMGITGALSFIVEGKRGEDSIQLIERRAKSQYSIAKGILMHIFSNRDSIKSMVEQERLKLTHTLEDSIAIRMKHIPDGTILFYPLKGLEGKDSIFTVTNYINKVKATLKVETPLGYLVPKSDSSLMAFLKRSAWKPSSISELENYKLINYRILKVNQSIDEELENKFPEIKPEILNASVDSNLYVFVSCRQLFQKAIVIAFEPQSMNGLVNYPDFDYLLNESIYPIIRVERNQ